jgi:hypothetical protein
MRGERGERGQISGHPIRSRRSPAPR